MAVNIDATVMRTGEYIKKKTLKDGTVKEYRCKRSYVVKSDRVVCGKRDLINRLHSCKDREKISKIKALFDELKV